MPKVARRDVHPLAGLPGTSYHVTARGLDGCAIFHTDRDRLYFLACLAESCDHLGLLCHAVVLMTNHIHLVVEDVPGLLSQFMHRLLGHYALYFNLSRRRRRRGPLFQGPFDAQVLDSEAYFRAACGYAFLNPVRCRTPLAVSAEEYAWSTAVFALAPESMTPRRFCEHLLERAGGADAVLASFPTPRRASSRRMLEHRFACLVEGSWLDRERLLAGRTPGEYREALRQQAKLGRPTAENAHELAETLEVSGPVDSRENCTGDAFTTPDAVRRPVDPPSPARRRRRRDPFERIGSCEAVDRIREVCARALACAPAELAAGVEQVTAYLAWRFGEGDALMTSELLSMGEEAFASARDAVRQLRAILPGWRELLWRAEWALRWRLLAAPCRA
jgi:putative transposase